MSTFKPTRSGSTVYGKVQTGSCTGSTSFTARMWRDNTQHDQYSFSGALTISLSAPCASGSHSYTIQLINNSTGRLYSTQAWFTC